MKRFFKTAWKYTKLFFLFLIRVIFWILSLIFCLFCFEEEEEKKKIKAEKTKAPHKFECEETITDAEGRTPRGEDQDLDKIFSGLSPEIKEQLKRDYELRHRKSVLMPIQRSTSAPSTIRTAREIVVNEMPILEEMPKREENTKSDL